MKKNFVRNILFVMVVVMAMVAVTGCSNQSESQSESQSAQGTIVNKYEGWEVIAIDIEVSYSSNSGSSTRFIASAIDTNGRLHAVKVNQIDIVESGNAYLSCGELLDNGLRGVKLFVTKDDYKALS